MFKDARRFRGMERMSTWDLGRHEVVVRSDSVNLDPEDILDAVLRSYKEEQKYRKVQRGIRKEEGE